MGRLRGAALLTVVVSMLVLTVGCATSERPLPGNRAEARYKAIASSREGRAAGVAAVDAEDGPPSFYGLKCNRLLGWSKSVMPSGPRSSLTPHAVTEYQHHLVTLLATAVAICPGGAQDVADNLYPLWAQSEAAGEKYWAASGEEARTGSSFGVTSTSVLYDFAAQFKEIADAAG